MEDQVPILSDNEGTLLALVLRVQPVTVYELGKIYQASPVSNFNTSPGKLYPLVKRLRLAELLVAERVEGDGRGSERLAATDAGRRAVKAWIGQILPHHLLLEDPLRTKVQSFDLLSREEVIAWVVEVKTALAQKLVDLEAYAKEVEVPYLDLVHDNAVSSVRARMDWLDRILRKFLKRPGP